MSSTTELAQRINDSIFKSSRLRNLVSQLDLRITIDLNEADEQNCLEVEACWTALSEGWTNIYMHNLRQELEQPHILPSREQSQAQEQQGRQRRSRRASKASRAQINSTTASASPPRAPALAATIASRYPCAEVWSMAAFALEHVYPPLLSLIAACRYRNLIHELSTERWSRLSSLAKQFGSIVDEPHSNKTLTSAVSPELLVLTLGPDFAVYREGMDAARRWLDHYISLSPSRSALRELPEAASDSLEATTPTASSSSTDDSSFQTASPSPNSVASMAEHCARLQPLKCLAADLTRHALNLATNRYDRPSRIPIYTTILREAFRSLGKELKNDPDAFFWNRAVSLKNKTIENKTANLDAQNMVNNSEPQVAMVDQDDGHPALDYPQQQLQQEDEKVEEEASAGQASAGTDSELPRERGGTPYVANSVHIYEKSHSKQVMMREEELQQKGTDCRLFLGDNYGIVLEKDSPSSSENLELPEEKESKLYCSGEAGKDQEQSGGNEQDREARNAAQGESIGQGDDIQQQQTLPSAPFLPEERTLPLHPTATISDPSSSPVVENARSSTLHNQHISTVAPLQTALGCDIGNLNVAQPLVIQNGCISPFHMPLSNDAIVQQLPDSAYNTPYPTPHQHTGEDGGAALTHASIEQTHSQSKQTQLQSPPSKRRKLHKEDGDVDTTSCSPDLVVSAKPFASVTENEKLGPNDNRRQPSPKLSPPQISLDDLSVSLSQLDDDQAWLDDNLVNFFIAQVCKQTHSMGQARLVNMMDSQVVLQDPQTLSSAHREFLVKGICEASITLFPLFVRSRRHWILACWRSTQSCLEIYDSLTAKSPLLSPVSHNSPIDCVRNWLRLAQDLNGEESSEVDAHLPGVCVFEGECPQQTNSHDCGLFVIAYARAICRGDSVAKVRDVHMLREYLRHFSFTPSPIDAYATKVATNLYPTELCEQYIHRSKAISEACSAATRHHDEATNAVSTYTQEQKELSRSIYLGICRWRNLWDELLFIARTPISSRNLSLLMPGAAGLMTTQAQVDVARATVSTLELQYHSMRLRQSHRSALASAIRLARTYRAIEDQVSKRKRVALGMRRALEGLHAQDIQHVQNDTNDVVPVSLVLKTGTTSQGLQDLCHGLSREDDEMQKGLGKYLDDLDGLKVKYMPSREEVSRAFRHCVVLIGLARLIDSRWAKEARFLC